MNDASCYYYYWGRVETGKGEEQRAGKAVPAGSGQRTQDSFQNFQMIDSFGDATYVDIVLRTVRYDDVWLRVCGFIYEIQPGASTIRSG